MRPPGHRVGHRAPQGCRQLDDRCTPASDQLGVLEACWRFFVLGVVQGLTEFLPISSTAHLKVVPVVLGWGDPGVAVTAVIQLGSIAGGDGLFPRRSAPGALGWGEALRAAASGKTLRPGWGWPSCLGTISDPAGGPGDQALGARFRQSPSAQPHLDRGGVDRDGAAAGPGRADGSPPPPAAAGAARDGILVGLAQMLALIPGVSRSGSTLTARPVRWLAAGRCRPLFLSAGHPGDHDRRAGGAQGRLQPAVAGGVLPMLVGIASSAVVSWLAIAWLLRYLQRHSTWWFVGYRLFFGLAILVGLAPQWGRERGFLNSGDHVERTLRRDRPGRAIRRAPAACPSRRWWPAWSPSRSVPSWAFEPGDRLLSINGRRPRDLIDLQLLVGEEELVLEVRGSRRHAPHRGAGEGPRCGPGAGVHRGPVRWPAAVQQRLPLLLHRPAAPRPSPQPLSQGRRLPAELSLRLLPHPHQPHRQPTGSGSRSSASRPCSCRFMPPIRNCAAACW